MQQQQLASEKVIMAALAQLTQQLQQQEKAQAQLAGQTPTIQRSLEQLRGEIAHLQQRQEEFVGNTMEIEHQQGNITSALQTAQDQQQQLSEQLQQLVIQQREWRKQSQQMFETQLQAVQQGQQNLGDQLRSSMQQMQDQLHAFQREHLDYQQNQGKPLQKILQQQQLEHAQVKESMTGLVEQLQQQHQEDISAMQADMRSWQQRISALEVKQQDHDSLLQQQRQQLNNVNEGAAASRHAPGVTQATLEDAITALERRMLHAVRVEGEAAQQLMELRVTATYERMRGDVSEVQNDVSAQLQQLTKEIQTAMVSQKEQQKQEQQQQPQAAQQQSMQEPGMLSSCIHLQSSDVRSTLIDQQCLADQQRQGEIQRTVFRQPRSAAAAAERLLAVKAAIAASQQQLKCQAGVASQMAADSKRTEKGVKQSIPGAATKALHGRKAATAAVKNSSAKSAPGEVDASQTAALVDSKKCKSAGSSCSGVAGSCAAATMLSGGARQVLSNHEVDVVLQLLGALHGVQRD